MKVTELKTLLLDNIEPYRGGPKWLLIELHTDEGLLGLGERVTGHSLNLRSQIELLHDLCDRFVIGRDPFNIEKIWQACYATLHDYRHPGMSHTPAISAIEMALWDIVGKATGQPIYNLLGGRYDEQLRADAYMPSDGVWEDPPLAGRIAETLVAEGNSACKLDPFMPYFPLPRDFPLWTIKHAASIFREIRRAVGDELEIEIGTHGQFSTSGDQSVDSGLGWSDAGGPRTISLEVAGGWWRAADRLCDRAEHPHRRAVLTRRPRRLGGCRERTRWRRFALIAAVAPGCRHAPQGAPGSDWQAMPSPFPSSRWRSVSGPPAARKNAWLCSQRSKSPQSRSGPAGS